MIGWLSDKQRTRPRRIDAKVNAKPGDALIEPVFPAGTVVLAGKDGEVQLAWTKDEKGRARPVPPGEYRIRTVRIERERDEIVWTISQAGPNGRTLQLEKGKTLKLEFEELIVFRIVKTKRKQKNVLRLGVSLTGTDRRGITIYRDGKRVPITYLFRTETRRIIWRGKMNYG